MDVLRPTTSSRKRLRAVNSCVEASLQRFRIQGGVQEKFTVAFGSKDRGVDDVNGCRSYLGNAGTDAVDRKLLRSGIAYDASFPHMLAARLKLRLDENNDFYGGDGRTHCFDDRRQNECRRNERDVHGKKANAGSKITG